MRHAAAALAVALLLVFSACSQPESQPESTSRETAVPQPAAPPAAPAAAPVPETPPIGAKPILVVETAKGTIEIETYPADAPKTVTQVVTLARRGFYNGQRVHRVVKDFVVQFGDPLSRDMTKKDSWGTGGSGKPIGVAEINKAHTHKLGAVAMAHAGDATLADSQMYITLAPVHRLDSGYAVFGQVISGMDVVQKLEMNDVIRRITVRDEAPAAK